MRSKRRMEERVWSPSSRAGLGTTPKWSGRQARASVVVSFSPSWCASTARAATWAGSSRATCPRPPSRQPSAKAHPAPAHLPLAAAAAAPSPAHLLLAAAAAVPNPAHLLRPSRPQETVDGGGGAAQGAGGEEKEAPPGKR